MAIGSTIGGLAGSLGGPAGRALGTAVGGLVGGAIEAIPSQIKTDAEKENERRLAQLRRQQEMGVLGLSEAEKQAMQTAGLNQIGRQLQQNALQARSVGAAGMGTGAGQEQLRMAQIAEQQASLASQVAQNTELKNLERKRELEDELQARIAAQAQMEQQRVQAVTSGLSGAVAGGIESYKQEQTIQGKKPTSGEIAAMANHLGISLDDASGLMTYLGTNPDATKYLQLLGGSK